MMFQCIKCDGGQVVLLYFVFCAIVKHHLDIHVQNKKSSLHY